jgi:hypothetical protein
MISAAHLHIVVRWKSKSAKETYVDIQGRETIH